MQIQANTPKIHDPLQEGMSWIVTFSMSLLTPRGSSWSPAHVHSRKGVYRAPGDGRCPPPTWTRASISYKLWSYSRYSAARLKSKKYGFPIGFPTVTAHYHFRCTDQDGNSLVNHTVNSQTKRKFPFESWQNFHQKILWGHMHELARKKLHLPVNTVKDRYLEYQI